MKLHPVPINPTRLTRSRNMYYTVWKVLFRKAILTESWNLNGLPFISFYLLHNQTFLQITLFISPYEFIFSLIWWWIFSFSIKIALYILCSAIPCTQYDVIVSILDLEQGNLDSNPLLGIEARWVILGQWFLLSTCSVSDWDINWLKNKNPSHIMSW